MIRNFHICSSFLFFTLLRTILCETTNTTTAQVEKKCRNDRFNDKNLTETYCPDLVKWPISEATYNNNETLDARKYLLSYLRVFL